MHKLVRNDYRKHLILNDTKEYNIVLISINEYEYSNLKKQDKDSIKFLSKLNIDDKDVLAIGGNKISNDLAEAFIPFIKYDKPIYSPELNNRPDKIYWCYASKEPFGVTNNVFKHETGQSAFGCAIAVLGNPEYILIFKANKDFDFNLITKYNVER